MMTDDQILEVVQAHKEGKEIEHRCKSGGIMGERWSTTRGCTPGWNFLECEYRVAPEPRKPREWWLTEKGNNEYDVTHYQPSMGWWIHVREVIE